jgi:hypothetical protein
MNKNISRSIINSKGEILFFGLEDFIKNIVENNYCFICGANPNFKKFNDEHIIPDWILKKYKLHSQKITLPNGTKINYGHYKVSCCQECNTELGKTYELPISKLLNKSYHDICDELKKNPSIFKILFKWMALIYLKTHLKDNSFLLERDKSKKSGFIADNYYWQDMHHIHCIARSHYTKAKIDENVYGTVLILPALKIGNRENFDYVDSETAKSVLLQLNEFSIIVVLNDSSFSYTMFKEFIDKIEGPLSSFQLREILAHLNYININLKERPVYQSNIKSDGNYYITSIIPEDICLIEEGKRISSPGEFLKLYVHELIGNIDNRETIINEIGEGKRNFLIDKKGQFINHSQI